MKCNSIYTNQREVCNLFEDARKKNDIQLAYKYIELIDRINSGEKILRVDIPTITSPIIWIDNPLKYSYLRKTHYMSCSSRFPVKTMMRNFYPGGVLVGYKCDSRSKHCYHFTYYWLKRHDRDISPNDVYKGPNTFGGFMPAEAVDPKTLCSENDATKIVKMGCDL
jgi:hypothetical protein